jgi:ADP-heptose:LPS heptosyltransferase
VLVVKVHGMGDAVLVRSAIEHLRRRDPSLEIGVLAGEATQEVLTVGSNFATHLYSQKQLTLWSTLRTLREIKARSYDAVLNFEQGSLAGSSFLHATKIRSRIGFVANGSSAKMPFLTHAVAFQTEASMWQSFLEIARLVDSHIPDSLLPMPLPISDEQLHAGRAWLQSRLTNQQVCKIAFHLGCGVGQAFKRWPLRNFAALAGKFSQHNPDLAIILTGQPHERGLLAQFGSIYKGSTVDATGLNSISKTASVLKECDLLVSNDTGVMHLGAAMGTPTVGLFGATSPNQWAPSGPRVAHVYATSAPCSPCINTYLNQVPTCCANPDYGRCMADIRVDSVLDAARRVIVNDWLG